MTSQGATPEEKYSRINFNSYRILNLFSKFYAAILVLNVLYNFVVEDWVRVYSTLFLILSFLLSAFFLVKKKAFIATNIITVGFYLVAFTHIFFLSDIITAYFILILAPCLLAVIMLHNATKLFYFSLSIVLYFVFNWYLELGLIANYYFLFGLVPSYFALTYFHKTLIRLSIKQKKLIAELKESNQELEFYSQMMSHDLVAPINTIKGFSELLKREHPITDTKAGILVDHIYNSAEDLKALTKEILLLSQLGAEEYKKEEVYLSDIINNVKKILSFEIAQKNVEFQLIKTNQKMLSWESGLKIVIQNLMTNAIKYQPLEPMTHIPVIKISMTSLEENYIIEFSDNGIGIDRTYHNDLFVPFKRFHNANQYKGTGLGLTITKKVINKLGGEICLLDKGTLGGCTFSISIPK